MAKWVQHKGLDMDEMANLLQETVETNMFTNGGPLTKKLEDEIRRRLLIDDDKAVIVTSSGTGALWAAKASMDLIHNRHLKFATQAFTFPSSAQGYLSDAIILDVDEGGGLSLEEADKIKDQIDGIIVTNVFGCVVDINRYTAWASENSKLLLFDNAATPMTMYGRKNSLNYGDAAICSLHHTKTLGHCEGGFIVCRSNMEPYVRRTSNFGINNYSIKPEWNRFGGNYKMSDLAAAGILQFWNRNFDKTIERNKQIYKEFKFLLPNIKLFPSFHDEYTIPVHSCIPIMTTNSNDILKKLVESNVMARKYYNPLLPLQHSSRIHGDIICLPCNSDVSITDVYEISKMFKEKYSVRFCEIDRNEQSVEVSAHDKENYYALRDFVKSFVEFCSNTYTFGKTLHIAPQDHEVFDGGDTLDIDPDSGCTYIADITRNNSQLIRSDSYDTVICTEVLEHTSNPFDALREINRMIKKGGRAIISVPCNFRIHGPLPDSWRLTEHGLRLMAKQCDFEVELLLALERSDRNLFPIDYGVVLSKN